MARFKVGDKVRIRENVPEGFNKRYINFVAKEMSEVYGGAIATVISCEDGHGYRLDVDSDSDITLPWRWYNRCLEQHIDWECFKSGNVDVHCPTKKSFKRFLKAAHAQGLCWRNGLPATYKTGYYKTYESKTCVGCMDADGRMWYHPLEYATQFPRTRTEVIQWR